MKQIWKKHRTGVTFFTTACLTLIYGCGHLLYREKGRFYGLWREYRTFYDVIELTSLFVPIAAAIVTLVAGGIDMSIWFSDNERKRLKEQIKDMKKRIKAQKYLLRILLSNSR